MTSVVLVLQTQAAGALPATKHKRGPSESVNLRDVGAGAGAKANLRECVMFRASQILRWADLLVIPNSLIHSSDSVCFWGCALHSQLRSTMQLKLQVRRQVPFLSWTLCCQVSRAAHSPADGRVIAFAYA